MWELVKRSLQRERSMTASQLGRPRRASVQRVHNEIVEAFLKAGRQRVRRAGSSRLGSVDSAAGEGSRGRGVRGGIWRAVSSLKFAISMAIRLLNPYVLISVAFGQQRSLMAHLSARVDTMRAVLSPRIGRRRRLTAWVHDILPERQVPEAASAVWQDGSLLCGIVETVVPGSCPGYDSLSPPQADRGATLWLGQKLAARYLGVPPVFSDDEFSQPYLTVYLERRMLRYLSALKAASARVDAERQRRLEALQSSGESLAEEDAFSLDTIAHSSLPPGESLLECVARGMGLVLGVQGRKSTFYLYLNPNHPHRHVQRLMRRSNTLQRQSSFEEEAGAILMQIRGPEGDFGAALLSTSPGSSSSAMGPSLAILNQQWYGRIPISYETTEQSVLVSFVPQTSGRHELILLQRGGSHVPGSPFSITVEDSSEVPDNNGTRRRFGSEPVDGLVVPTPRGITKATSYESGLNKGHRRIGSEGSDPGTRSEGGTPEGIRNNRRVVARVVDFVTEKMLLTEDGKLEKLPKRRRGGLEKTSIKGRVLVNEDDEVRETMQNRRYTTLYSKMGRMRRLEVDEPIYGTYPGRRSPVENGKSETTYGLSKSGLEVDIKRQTVKSESRECNKMIRVSDVASHKEKEDLDSINFREHCRRILWLCDILLKHSPRQEGLEMLNTAGDILEGKRVHPTILEESEPEDFAAAVPPLTRKRQPLDEPYPLKARSGTAQSTSYALPQRLQRASSNTGSPNEASWKDGRRQFHSWDQQDRGGSGTARGRLVHKGGSYRGVVVRDMTPEALTGAYAGGDLIEDEESLQRGELEVRGLAEERYLLEFGRPAPRMPHHSLPKRRPPSLAKQMESRGHSLETLEQRTSTSEREKEGGRATVSGKELNKSIASNGKRQINYSDRDSGRERGGGESGDQEKGIKAGASRGEGGVRDDPRRHSEREDKRPSGIVGKNIILAAAVALAEGGGEAKREEESWEETLSSIGTKAFPGKEGEDDKELLDASSKGEPPPIGEFKGEKGGGDEGVEGGEAVASAGAEKGEDQEEREGGTTRESSAPASAEAETPGAREIKDRLPPPPPGPLAPSLPTTHGPSAEQFPESPEGMVSKSSDVAGGSTSSGSGYPRTISEKGPKEEEREAIKEEERERRVKDENGPEEIEDEADDGEMVKEVVKLGSENKETCEREMSAPEVETTREDQRELKTVDEKVGDAEIGVAEKEKEKDVRLMEEHENVENKLAEIEAKRIGDKEGDKREHVKRAEEKSIIFGKENNKGDDMKGGEANRCVVEKKAIRNEDEVKIECKIKGKRREGEEEGSVSESGEEEESIIEHEEKEIRKSKEYNPQEIRPENETMKESGAVKAEEKVQQLLNTEKCVRGKELEVEEVKIEAIREKIKESYSEKISENSSRQETEKIEEIFINKDCQAVDITKEVDFVNKTVSGNEDEDIQSSHEKNKKQVGGTEEVFFPQNSRISQTDIVSEVSIKNILGEEKVLEEEEVDKIAKDGIVKQCEGGSNVGQIMRDEIKGREENKLIDEKSSRIEIEATGKCIERHDNRKIDIDEGSADIGDVRNEIKEATVKEDSVKVGKFAEGRDSWADRKIEGGEQVTKRLLSEAMSDERADIKEGGGQDTTDEVVYTERGGCEGKEKFAIELEREDAWDRSVTEEVLQHKEGSANEKISSDKGQVMSDEKESVGSVRKGQVKIEKNTETGDKLPIRETQDESGKISEEPRPKEEILTEEREGNERIDKDEMKKVAGGNSLEGVDIGNKRIDTTNLKGRTLVEYIQYEKNEEKGNFLVEKRTCVLEENKGLDAYCKEDCSEMKETKNVDKMLNDDLSNDESGVRKTKKIFKEFDTFDSIGITSCKKLTEEFLDENKLGKPDFKEDRNVTEKKDPEENVAATEEIKEEEKKNKEQEHISLEKEGKDNKILGNEESSGKPKDFFKEKIKPMSLIEVKVESLEKREEHKSEKENETDGEFLKLENIKKNKEIERDEKENKGNTNSVFGKEMKEEIENTPTEYMKSGENKIKEFNESTPIEIGEQYLKEDKHDTKAIVEEMKCAKESKEMREIYGVQIFDDKIREYLVAKTEFFLHDLQIKEILCEESTKEGCTDEHNTQGTVDIEEEIENRGPLEGETQKIDLEGDIIMKEDNEVWAEKIQDNSSKESQQKDHEERENYLVKQAKEEQIISAEGGEIEDRICKELQNKMDQSTEQHTTPNIEDHKGDKRTTVLQKKEDLQNNIVRKEGNNIEDLDIKSMLCNELKVEENENTDQHFTPSKEKKEEVERGVSWKSGVQDIDLGEKITAKKEKNLGEESEGILCEEPPHKMDVSTEHHYSPDKEEYKGDKRTTVSGKEEKQENDITEHTKEKEEMKENVCEVLKQKQNDECEQYVAPSEEEENKEQIEIRESGKEKDQENHIVKHTLEKEETTVEISENEEVLIAKSQKKSNDNREEYDEPRKEGKEEEIVGTVLIKVELQKMDLGENRINPIVKEKMNTVGLNIEEILSKESQQIKEERTEQRGTLGKEICKEDIETGLLSKEEVQKIVLDENEIAKEEEMNAEGGEFEAILHEEPHQKMNESTKQQATPDKEENEGDIETKVSRNEDKENETADHKIQKEEIDVDRVDVEDVLCKNSEHKKYENTELYDAPIEEENKEKDSRVLRKVEQETDLVKRALMEEEIPVEIIGNEDVLCGESQMMKNDNTDEYSGPGKEENEEEIRGTVANKLEVQEIILEEKAIVKEEMNAEGREGAGISCEEREHMIHERVEQHLPLDKGEYKDEIDSTVSRKEGKENNIVETSKEKVENNENVETTISRNEEHQNDTVEPTKEEGEMDVGRVEIKEIISTNLQQKKYDNAEQHVAPNEEESREADFRKLREKEDHKTDIVGHPLEEEINAEGGETEDILCEGPQQKVDESTETLCTSDKEENKEGIWTKVTLKEEEKNDITEHIIQTEEINVENVDIEDILSEELPQRNDQPEPIDAPDEETTDSRLPCKAEGQENEIAVHAEKKEEINVEIYGTFCGESQQKNKNTDEPGKEEITDVESLKEEAREVLEENTAAKGEINAVRLESKGISLNKESHREEIVEREQYSDAQKDQNKSLRESAISFECIPDQFQDKEREEFKPLQTPPIERTIIEVEVNILDTSTNKDEVKDEVGCVKFERTREEERTDTKAEVVENTSHGRNRSEEKDENEDFSQEEENVEKKLCADKTPTNLEGKEMMESEKEQVEIFPKRGGAKEEEPYMESDAPDEKVQAPNLAEVGGKKAGEGGESGGLCEIERTRDRSEEKGGNAEGGISEEKCPTEDLGKVRQEREKGSPPGEGEGSLTYSEIIGRILYTDSFPSESLDWFEEEGRKGAGEVVEGRMESMEGNESGPEVTTRLAVGDEAWREPEISGIEPFRLAGDPEGQETLGKEGAVIGGREEGRREEEEEVGELDEELGRDPWSTGLPPNFDEDEHEIVGFHRKYAEGGLRVGVGVVVAGGIASRDASRRDSSDGGDAAWRRSRWRASRSKSIEEGLPLPKDDAVERQWEEICVGIDAMEDGSISEVIAEVSGKRRRRRTRKERDERSGKAITMGERRWGRDGDEAAGKEPPIAESALESVEAEGAEEGEAAAAGAEGRPPASGRPQEKGDDKEEGVGCEATAGAEVEGGAVEAKKEDSEKLAGAEASRDGRRRVGMLEEPWWLSSSGSGSLGGVKGGETRSWGAAEEEGVEAKEDVEEMENKEKAGAWEACRRDEKENKAKGLGDKVEGDSLSETAPPNQLGIKVADAKVECHPQIDSTGLHTEHRIERSNKKVEELEMVARKCDDVKETPPEHLEREKVYEVKESNEKSDIFGGESTKEEDDGDKKDDNKRAGKGISPAYEEKKYLKEAIKAESEETKFVGLFTFRGVDKCPEDSEVKGSKSMQSAGDEICVELKNKHPLNEVELNSGVSCRGKFKKAESSEEWEFVNTEVNSENDKAQGEREGRDTRNKCASNTKKMFLGSILGNKENAQSPGAVEMGMGRVNDLLKPFVDIAKDKGKASHEGTIPKREGEELYEVRVTLDEWEGKKERDCADQGKEVVVGEFDLLGEWEAGVETIGYFDISTKEQMEGDRKDENEEEVEGKSKGETHAESYDEKSSKQSGEDFTTNESESNFSAEDEFSSDESESSRKRKNKHIKNNDITEEDDDIEEIIRPDPDDWSEGIFTFTDPYQRSTFRNLEDLLGGNISFRKPASSSQFNLWPSQEAFGGKGTWLEHIDMDAFMSTAQSRQQSYAGEGLTENMKKFAKTYTGGRQKGDPSGREQYNFSSGVENEDKIQDESVDEEEDIVLVEQDFDDRSDEIEANLGTGSTWDATYHPYDVKSHPGVRKGDAFIIFESPSVCTRMTQEGEQMSSDDDTDDRPGIENIPRSEVSCDDDEMLGLQLDGEWEEGIIFLDDEDVQTEGRRGSGEYMKFGGDVVEKEEENDLWVIVPQASEDSSASGGMAFASVTDAKDVKEKTPVLPTGRWCPRLPMLSPVMSAISEEESDEIFTEKEEKQKEETASFKTGKESGLDNAKERHEMKRAESDNCLEESVPPVPTSSIKVQEKHSESINEDEDSGCLTVTLHAYDDEGGTENDDEIDSRHELPKLDVEVEDGFGESFSRRRSSTSSVLSDSGTVEPPADCGAAFVVSSELAVTLALGVAITQIIPQIIDQPEVPPLPQVEEATDALTLDKTNEDQLKEQSKEGEGLSADREQDPAKIFKDNKQNAGVQVDRVPYTAFYGESHEGGQIMKKTIDTQTEPVLVLEEKKEILGSRVTLVADILRMDKPITENKSRENENELESEICGDRSNSDAPKTTTGEENVKEKEFLLGEETNSSRNIVAFKTQGAYHEGRDNHRDDNTQFQERNWKEVKDEGEKSECTAYKSERMDDTLNNIKYESKTTPGAREVIDDSQEAENKHRCNVYATEKDQIEKDGKKNLAETREIGSESRVDGGDSGNSLIREQKCDWYDDDGGEIECWSNGRLIAKEFVEREGVRHKKLEEKKIITFEQKQGAPEKERSVLAEGEAGGGRIRQAEGAKKFSPSGGARRKESYEEKTKGSPPRDIPPANLLGWSSESGNGAGLGYAGVDSRRESVFDDYNFSLWESGFQLKRDAGKQKVTNQDSTGLEYYLDVDQLLNVPLEATEPEVKYVSAKEIMDTFTRGIGIDSPEKVMEKEAEIRGGKKFQPCAEDKGAVGGLPNVMTLSGAIKEELTEFSNIKEDPTTPVGRGTDPWEDDLFAEFLQESVPPVQQTVPETLHQVFENKEFASIRTSFDEQKSNITQPGTVAEDVTLKEEKADEGGININRVPGPGCEERKLDFITKCEVKEEESIKTNKAEVVSDRKVHVMQQSSNKGIDSGTQRETQASGSKVRNIIDIFEHPASKKGKKERGPDREEKSEKHHLIFDEKITTEEVKRSSCAAEVSEVVTTPPAFLEVVATIASTETEYETTKTSAALSSFFDATETAEGARNSLVEVSEENQKEECAAALAGGKPASSSTEFDVTEAKEIFNERAMELEGVKPPEGGDNRDSLLSLTEDPVVGWDAIKVATEVEKIILSTGNGAEQTKIRGGVVIGAEPDKTFEQKKQGAESSAADMELGNKWRENIRESSEAKRELDYEVTKSEVVTVGVGGERSEGRGSTRKKSLRHLSKSSSLEEYRTAVSEAYQFLDSLGDTVDEDEERLAEEGTKELGGQAEDSVGGTGSKVEEFHPCEELPDDRIEAIPRGVEGAPTEGLTEAQSSSSSPERFKTTESSSSSSPYSSLPTFADVSSGILSSASSKDENFTKLEDGASRRGWIAKSECRGGLEGETERVSDGGSVMPEDYLDEEIDSHALAKMNVASRKEYWDRRLQRAQEKSKEVVTAGAKRPVPLRVSGIVARGMMSFEKSKSRDDYTTSDSGGDGGKSSSESSPSWRGKSFSQRPKSPYSRGTKSALPSETGEKNQGAEKTFLPEEKKILKTSEELSVETTGKGSDVTLDKGIPTDASETRQQEHPLKKLDDEEDLSQIPVAKRKEIWDQKLQKMSEDESPPSSLEYRRIENKKSKSVKSTGKLVRKLSTEDTTEKTVPSTEVKDIESKCKQQAPEQSLSIDSSSLDDRAEREEVTKKRPPKKTGAVSRLAKLFSSPTPEPPPPKYGGRPINKGKYSKGLDKGNVKSKTEPIKETSIKTEIPTPTLSHENTELCISTAATSEIGSSVQGPDEVYSETVSTGGKDEIKVDSNNRLSDTASVKATPPQDTVTSISSSTDNVTPDMDNLASRRQKYLKSVQQSLEGEENRSEVTGKISEIENPMKDCMGRKGVTDVKNIWEKRASLEGSSSSESMNKTGKTLSSSTETDSKKKKIAQEQRPSAKGKMESTNKNESEHQEKSVLQEDEAKTQANSSLEKSISQQEKVLTPITSGIPKEIERREGGTSSSKVISRKGVHLKKKPENETSQPLSVKSVKKQEVDLALRCSSELREEKPSNEGRSQKIIESTNSAQRTNHPNREDEKMKLPKASGEAKKSDKSKATDRSSQLESKMAPQGKVAEATFASQERRTPPDKNKSPAGKVLPPERERPSPAGRKMPPVETEPSAFKGRRHSSACVNPPKMADISKLREKWGSWEEKAIEAAAYRGKRNSLEIRVTDDEDICVMREVTPLRWSPQEKMETHEEEDGKQAEVEGEMEGAEGERSKAPPPPPSTTGAKRRPMPSRTPSIQVSGIVASGRRMFESGKATAVGMPVLSEDAEKKSTRPQAPKDLPAARRGAEERRRVPTQPKGLEGVDEGDQERGRERERRLATSKGRRMVEREALRVEGTRPHEPEAGARELYRAVPAVVEGEHRGTDVRVQICDPEETCSASKGEEGGNDGRSATSRRASKGKAPTQKQPPPSAASSPDTESEGAADTKLLGFLSTPAAQARRHSALDVATLRSFGAEAPEGSRMRRRGSGDLGSPCLRKEDESKKRFTRARAFFETLEKGKESPPSGEEDSAQGKPPSGIQSTSKKKKKKAKEAEEEGAWRGSVGKKAGSVKHRPIVVRGPMDSSESTTESDKEKKQRRKARRSASERTHSAPGSDVESSGSASHNHPSLHRRKRDRELVLRNRRFGGSEREVKVSERFNVMDLFRDVAGPGTGVSSGRATPLGIPHQAAVLAALRSVEDVRSSETTSPYDRYRPVEADNDCEPKAAAAGDDEGEPSASANDENANVEEEGNVTFSSPMTLCVKKEYQAEYPHLPMTSPRHSRHRSSNTDLIPRNVLLQLDTNQNTPKKSSSSRRSIAELF